MGTQTSKPLHGDEERRMRFRSPRTPMNSDGSTSNLTTTSASDTATSSDTHNSGSQRARTWPCSNCHATVSNEESRCPYCGGIQVTIPRSPPSTAKAMINSNLLLQRFKAASPTTPVARKEINPGKLLAFLNSESHATANTSAMSLEYPEAENDSGDANKNTMSTASISEAPYHNHHQDDRPKSALSQSSSISQNFNLPLTPQQSSSPSSASPSSPGPLFVTPQSQQVSEEDRQHATEDSSMFEITTTHDNSSFERPPDPVALTLEAAQLRSGTPSPSPQTGAAAKRKATARPLGGGFEGPKKKMVLP